MLELGILADDLTGGMMVASLLEREGVRCPLVTSPDALDTLSADAEAVVIGRNIRLIPADEARADATRSARALRAIKTKRVYYKYCATFDSTEEGNIGPITEALMEALDTDRTIVCPAFPEYSVTIFQGRLFLGSTPLGDSFKQHDPVTPMTNSNLVEVMQAQAHGKVGLLPHGTLIKGKAVTSDAIDKQVKAGIGMFVIDAVDDDDATRIAELVTDWPLSTGADAMPMFLARTFHQEESPEQRTLLPPSPGGEAVIAGSCAPNTLARLLSPPLRTLRVWNEPRPNWAVMAQRHSPTNSWEKAQSCYITSALENLWWPVAKPRDRSSTHSKSNRFRYRHLII